MQRNQGIANLLPKIVSDLERFKAHRGKKGNLSKGNTVNIPAFRQ
jgi:hypothetical protein